MLINPCFVHSLAFDHQSMDMMVIGVGAEMDSDPTPTSNFKAKVFVVAPSMVGSATKAWILAGAKQLVDVDVSVCIFLFMP